MKNLKFNFLIFILYCTLNSFSQTKLFLSVDNDLFFKNEKPLSFLPNSQKQFELKPICSLVTVTQTNKKPMFCKMEDKLHKRFNVWILLRAGSDSDYRKMIQNAK